ncbi:MAG TPA: metal-dependent hydrolase [Longimicrobiales bacterium]|nr:metal-dependent hydrolase [Longimicrobiales bacterium]
MAQLTWHGHATFGLKTDSGHRVIIDPFLDDNPRCDVSVEDIDELDFILCTHGHEDHFADAIPLAKKTGAMLISTYEIVSYAGTRGVQNSHPMHIGGGHRFPFGHAKMTPALHGGQVAGEGAGPYTTMPGGFLLDMDGKRLYHAGDTALIVDMQLLRGRVDVALLPIGDNFTMGPEDAVRAVEFIEPGVVIPMHYGTWEVIDQDPHAFADAVGDRARTVVLEPGATWEF